MDKKYLILAALLATSCAGGAAPMDPEKFLSSLQGPKILGISDSQMEAAKNAEKQGDFKQAAIFYQQILEKHPDNTEAALGLADSYRRSGEPDKAIMQYDALLARDSKLIAAKEGKGLALIAKGDFDTPASLFDDVIKADATRWKTLNALGIMFSTRNLQPEAQQYFNEALKYHADSPTILNNLGLSQALTKDYDKATDTLHKASGLSGAGSIERKRIDLNMALVFASAGRIDDARAIAENYLSGASLNNNLGLYAHLAKDDQMARAYLNMALSESKTYYARAWDNLQEISANPSAAEDKTKPSMVKKTEGKSKHGPKSVTKTAATTKMPADLFPSAEVPATE